MATVQTRRTGRRAVRRRAQGTLERAWATVLDDVPAELHEPLMTWVDARRSEHEARLALSTVMTHTGVRWLEVNRLARVLGIAA